MLKLPRQSGSLKKISKSLEHYRMLNDYLITIDIDWAPDSAISETAHYLIENEVKATWFITHASPEIEKLKEYPHLFELGVHPNFKNIRLEADDIKIIMLALNKIVPEAKSIRTHSLVQSTPLIKILREDYNFLYDVSLFLPLTPNIMPHHLFLSENSYICRIPYFWEDDEAMFNPKSNFNFSDKHLSAEGIKIFNFHPIHIALNSCSMRNYYSMKLKFEIPTCKARELDSFKNNTTQGTGTFFRELVNFIRISEGNKGSTISELARRWSKI
jgi:hypothetical protein